MGVVSVVLIVLLLVLLQMCKNHRRVMPGSFQLWPFTYIIRTFLMKMQLAIRRI